MKNQWKYLFISVYALTVSTYAYEYISMAMFEDELLNGRYGISAGSKSYELAKENKDYILQMTKAVRGSLDTLKHRTICLCASIVFSLLFLIDSIRVKVFRYLSKLPTLYIKEIRSISKPQVAYTNCFVFFFVSIFMRSYLKAYTYVGTYNIYQKCVYYAVLYFLVCPLIVVALFVLLQQFGFQIVIAFYISLLIVNSYDIFIDNKHSSKLQRVSYQNFDLVVQKYLKETHLEKKVFVDKSINETNAALAGLGDNAIIELYGDFENMPNEQKDSILLHEIGHSVDRSLVKKLSVYFLVHLIDMFIIICLQAYVGKYFESDDISKDTAFIILTMIYFLCMKDWTMMLYKLSSHTAEQNADLLAKKEGFGGELARSLFNISVAEASYINPTWLYNALYAMHSSVYDRIEYLYK